MLKIEQDARVAGTIGPIPGDVVPAGPSAIARWWIARLNAVRLALCNALGITYAMRQVRANMESLTDTQRNQADIIAKIVPQLNRNTKNVGLMHQKHREWESANPQLRRVAMRLEQAQASAERAQLAPTNGKGVAHPNDAQAPRSRLELMLEQVRRDFQRWAQSGKPDPGPVLPIVGTLFRGEAVTNEELHAVAQEVKRLIQEAE